MENLRLLIYFSVAFFLSVQSYSLIKVRLHPGAENWCETRVIY